MPFTAADFLDVAHVDDRFRRKQLQRREDWLLLGRDVGHAGRLAVPQGDQRLLHHGELRLGFLVAGLRLLLGSSAALIQALHVGEHELGLDHLGIGQRIDAVLDVGYVVVLEAAQHIGDGIDFADVGQKLVAEALALGGAAHQAGDVDKGKPRWDDLPGLGYGGEFIEALVRYTDLANVRLDGAERVVRRLRSRGLRQRVEEGRLADVRQTHDAAFEAHDLAPALNGGRASRRCCPDAARCLETSAANVKPSVAAAG